VFGSTPLAALAYTLRTQSPPQTALILRTCARLPGFGAVFIMRSRRPEFPCVVGEGLRRQSRETPGLRASAAAYGCS